ncbi:hypothetical protein ACU5AX_16195 [Sphingomonas sp. XXL09]|uniref:hypothetical protein n=1 Tax=Sphingomonas sp. XXL09 TaxID=3457787 RepID=UPI00406BD075
MTGSMGFGGADTGRTGTELVTVAAIRSSASAVAAISSLRMPTGSATTGIDFGSGVGTGRCTAGNQARAGSTVSIAASAGGGVDAAASAIGRTGIPPVTVAAVCTAGAVGTVGTAAAGKVMPGTASACRSVSGVSAASPPTANSDRAKAAPSPALAPGAVAPVAVDRMAAAGLIIGLSRRGWARAAHHRSEP